MLVSNPKLYVLVSKDCNKGFWEVDIYNKKALFRDKKDIIPIAEIQDMRGKAKDISEYLLKIQEFEYVKEIIKDRKVIFSNRLICDYSITGLDKHNPTSVWHCDNIARLMCDGHPRCQSHNE